MGTLSLLGGPVSVDGRLLVINVSSRQLELTAVNPSTGTVAWQRPYSASYMTAGEPFPPAVVDGVVIDLQPVAGVPDEVSNVGVNVVSGSVLWTYPDVGYTQDAPAPCGGSGTFCMSWTSPRAAGLIEIAAKTGRFVRLVANVARDLGSNLYQANGSQPVLIQIGSQGQWLWQRSTVSIFGPANNDPNYGWDVDPIGSLDVGTLGQAPQGSTSDLGAATTTGFEIANGQRVWTDSGIYNCEGTLEVFSTPTLCRFKGTIDEGKAGRPSFTHLSVSIEGFDPRTGRVTWSQPDEDPAPLVEAGNLPFLDGNHLVITQNGASKILDLANGALSPVRPGQIFWCASTPLVKVQVPSGTTQPDERVGMDQFFGCSANGKAVAGEPATQPSLVGVTLSGRFYWPSTHGLEGEPAS